MTDDLFTYGSRNFHRIPPTILLYWTVFFPNE